MSLSQSKWKINYGLKIINFIHFSRVFDSAQDALAVSLLYCNTNCLHQVRCCLFFTGRLINPTTNILDEICGMRSIQSKRLNGNWDYIIIIVKMSYFFNFLSSATLYLFQLYAYLITSAQSRKYNLVCFKRTEQNRKALLGK